MKLEDEIVRYLREYGNTSEADLVQYCEEAFNCSSAHTKKAIRRMVIGGRVYYVIHDKFESPRSYLSLKEPLPSEVSKVLIEALSESTTAEDDVKRILEEAAAIAARRIRDRTSYSSDAR